MVQQTIPAISLWQPFASLIACGAKPFETRHWCAPARVTGQRIAIHAAKRRPPRAEVDELFADVSDALGFCHWPDRIPYGAVVCTALLVAARRVVRKNLTFFELEDGRRFEDDGFGDYSAGRWVWELRDVQAFPQPIPALGGRSWWQWTAP